MGVYGFTSQDVRLLADAAGYDPAAHAITPIPMGRWVRYRGSVVRWREPHKGDTGWSCCARSACYTGYGRGETAAAAQADAILKVRALIDECCRVHKCKEVIGY